MFFSLILHGVSEVVRGNLTNVLSDNVVHSLDSVTLHIHSGNDYLSSSAVLCSSVIV